ncbi:ubiquitin carboxyl-terminal hydrolase 8 isoform X1 [Cynara cardunculus var. scolymus]|uniref:ubiquitin carboxyl-terminal hydrolase 8 isoform X1 n=1 Tax=Cynara cardunculus var. scolymus TaxID=59895 RepID=UPI000D62BD1E|nr:ubiquitin carboxyl-terminal hydrolase 8 isoform X1 [Cynara cardunculus var. scolymus]
MEVSPSDDDTSHTSQQQCSSDNHRLYLVPFRWWKEAQGYCDPDGGTKKKRGVLYDALPASSSYVGPMKILNNIFKSDLAFNLVRKGEEDEQQQDDDNNDNDSSENNGGDDRDINGVSGRNYALVVADMWLQALKWHSDSKGTVKDGKSFLAAEDDMTDVYPLQLKLSILQETNTLGVRISKKDNAVECYRRACKIFSIESELLHIWDFSGQTTQFLLDEKNKNAKDSLRQSEQEILLELQVYGLSDLTRNKDMKKDEMTSHLVKTSSKMNGSTGNSICLRSNSAVSSGSYCEKGSLGLTGLQNLGNTCFMNSSLQCLAHTPKLVDYFLGDHRREINHDNPLGMNGEIALAFGDLLKTLWAPGATAVPPRTFKSKLAHFAPQFSGFNQHDSQELLAFLLDGLHEDLNRVKCKPYAEAKDGDGRPDEDIADEYWQNHLARNDSIIVDVCQGQYRSTLVCPICRKVSVTFDPFMYLSLPLPSTSMRTMTLTTVPTDGSAQPTQVTVTVPKHGKFEDLVRALRTMCSLGNDETLMVAEVYNNHIIRFLGEPTDSLSLIRDDDRLVAYNIQKDFEKFSRVVFVHQQIEKNLTSGKNKSSCKPFGLPLVACGEIAKGHDIRDLYFNVLKPLTIKAKSSSEDDNNTGTVPIEDEERNNVASPEDTSEASDTVNGNSRTDCEVQFYLTDDNGNVKGSEIVMDELLNSTELGGRLNILVCWSDKMLELYDQSLLTSPAEVYKPALFSKRPQESISLYKCLEAFLKEEPLGPEDMWYCPGCKKHRQASKKLDLWRLPEILVIHLKRFSYSRFLKNKLETFVDFPIHDLDLTTFVAYNNGRSSHRYMLYAISNHYGSMGGGHYTAFIRHDGDRWYDFDDSHVSPIDEDRIKTSAAYVLFYRRLEDI